MAGDYRQLKTSVAQTAANAAVQLVEQRIAENSVSTVEAFNEVFDAIFAKLSPVVDADNVMLAEAGATKAAAKVSGDPGDTLFTGGKFKGLTVREVYELSADKAKEDYGHQYGDGASYITQYAATSKNTNDKTRVGSEAFLASLKG